DLVAAQVHDTFDTTTGTAYILEKRGAKWGIIKKDRWIPVAETTPFSSSLEPTPLGNPFFRSPKYRYASRALTLRGLAYAHEGDLVKAWRDFHEATLKDPENIRASAMLLIVLLTLHVF